MIEAVNSVLQSTPALRANLEQTSTSDSYAANPDRTQKVASPGYISPYYTISGTSLVLEIRNIETGKVLDKIPSKATPPARKTETTDPDTTPVQTYVAPQVQQSPTTAPTTTGVQISDTTSNDNSSDTQVSAGYAQSFAAFAAAQQAGNSSAGQSSVSLLA